MMVTSRPPMLQAGPASGKRRDLQLDPTETRQLLCDLTAMVTAYSATEPPIIPRTAVPTTDPTTP